MNKKIYSNYADLAKDMINVRNDGGIVYTVLFYSHAKELIKEIIKADRNIELVSVSLYDPSIDGYDKEYYITLDEDGLFVEKAFVEGENDGIYLRFVTDYLFISGDANAKILKCTSECNSCQVEFSCESDICEKCNCHCSSLYTQGKKEVERILESVNIETFPSENPVNFTISYETRLFDKT